MSALRRRSHAQQQHSFGASWQSPDEGSNSYYDDGLPERRTSSSEPSSSSFQKHAVRLPVLSQRAWLVVGLALTLAPWLHHSSWANKLKMLQKSISKRQASQRRLVSDLQKVKKDFQKTSMEQAEHEKINNELLTTLHVKGDNIDTESSAYLESKELEDKYLQRIQELESTLSKKAASMAIVKHGNGPYHVVVSLKNEPVRGVGKSFMIETVPTPAMPLSIGHFLRLVDHQFFDGLVFLHNRYEGTSIVQTAEIAAETSTRVEASEYMADPELTHLAYAEHNDAHRIQKYSVAFTGKPGGPNFYIFMDKKYNPADQLGEACFGKVIQGQAVLEAMVDSQRQGKKHDIFTIESVRVLPQDG